MSAGFFVDVRVLNSSTVPSMKDVNDEDRRSSGECGQDDSVDETQNLMLKLKFLPYKVNFHKTAYSETDKFVIQMWFKLTLPASVDSSMLKRCFSGVS